MRREQASVARLTLERGVPLVPCAYAEGRGERWKRRILSCGELVPYQPKHPCPNCGQHLIPSHAREPRDTSRVIEGNTLIIDAETHQVAVIHLVVASQLASELAVALREVKFDTQVFANATTTARLNGMAVTHRTFGFQPPQPMRRRYCCSSSQFNAEYPVAMAKLGEFCRLSEDVFRTYAPTAHDDTAHKVADLIAPAWRIAGTPWTSGIVNQTAALPYHVDKDNVPSSWSAMIVARRDISGGLLHLADYDTYLAVPHGSITIFDGQSVVHGVTPLHVDRPGGIRFSAVAYSKSQMKKCAPDPADEPRRGQMEATLAEDRRITRSPTPERESVSTPPPPSEA